MLLDNFESSEGRCEIRDYAKAEPAKTLIRGRKIGRFPFREWNEFDAMVVSGGHLGSPCGILPMLLESEDMDETVRFVRTHTHTKKDKA